MLCRGDWEFTFQIFTIVLTHTQPHNSTHTHTHTHSHHTHTDTDTHQTETHTKTNTHTDTNTHTHTQSCPWLFYTSTQMSIIFPSLLLLGCLALILMK